MTITAGHQVEVRKATLADSATLAAWDEKPHVKAATSNDGQTSFDADWLEELGPREDGTEFFIAEVNGKPIGAMQLIDPATERSQYWGPMNGKGCRAIDIWIGDERYLGQGYGTSMMHYVLDYCFADPSVDVVLIDPLVNNVRSHQFYRRLGFTFVERRQFDEDSDCFVFRLLRADWEV